MRGKFLLLFAAVMKSWGVLINLSELLMCRCQGEERYFTTGQAGVIGSDVPGDLDRTDDMYWVWDRDVLQRALLRKAQLEI